MKSNIKTTINLRLLASTILIITMFNLSLAQQRPQQNIRRITVTNKYVLENGKKTSKFWAVYQEMFDSLGRLHTEVDWDFTDHNPHGYIWHTYVGKQRIKTAIFKDEKLQTIKEYVYNRDSLVSQEVIKKVKPGDTSVYLSLTYKYNQFKKPIQIDAKAPNSKTVYTTKSTYDLKGTELTRKVKVKTGYIPIDSIISLISKPSYDSIGRLIKNPVTIVYVDNSKIFKDYNYTYDKKNNITGISILNDKGKLVSREERIYDPNRNRLQQIKYYDSNNNLIKWLAKRYEIYRTSDTRIGEIDY